MSVICNAVSELIMELLKDRVDKLLDLGVDKYILNEVFPEFIDLDNVNENYKQKEPKIKHFEKLYEKESEKESVNTSIFSKLPLKKVSDEPEEEAVNTSIFSKLPLKKMAEENTTVKSTKLPVQSQQTKSQQAKVKSQESMSDESEVATIRPQYVKQEKYPQDYSDGSVVLVLNYGPASHGLFGDFKQLYAEFKNVFLMKKNNNGQSDYAFNSGLKFGPGWLLKNKAKLPELKKALRLNRINFREVEFNEYLEEIIAASAKKSVTPKNLPQKNVTIAKTVTPTNSTSTTTNKSTSTTTNKSTTPKTATTKPLPLPIKAQQIIQSINGDVSLVMNAWGNFEDEESGFIFMMVPIGKGGADEPIVIGAQHPSPPKGTKGIDTLVQLSNDYREECEKRGYKYITLDIIEIIRKKNKTLASKLEPLIQEDNENEEINESESEQDVIVSNDDSSSGHSNEQ